MSEVPLYSTMWFGRSTEVNMVSPCTRGREIRRETWTSVRMLQQHRICFPMLLFVNCFPMLLFVNRFPMLLFVNRISMLLFVLLFVITYVITSFQLFGRAIRRETSTSVRMLQQWLLTPLSHITGLYKEVAFSPAHSSATNILPYPTLP